jgi:hypothetical protein
METYLPMYLENDNTLVEGQLIKYANNCFSKVNTQKCTRYYETIKLINGFHKCPYGMSSYVYTNEINKVIFTSFRTRGYIDKDLYKKLEFSEARFNPILDESTTNDIITSCKKEIENFELNRKLTDFFKSLKHETIYWSGEIQNLSEKLIKESTGKKKDKNLLNIATKIFHFGRLIGFNFTRFDFLNDNLTTSKFDKVTEKVFNRFNVIIRCLEPSANEKYVYIKKNGESYSSIKLNLETFDILPYVILENAIKYSPKEELIDINFSENSDWIFIEFVSYGPKIDEDEYQKIFEQGYRGKNTRNLEEHGNGIGLYLARRICEIHNIKYSVLSYSPKKIGQKEYYRNKFRFDIPLSNYI